MHFSRFFACGLGDVKDTIPIDFRIIKIININYSYFSVPTYDEIINDDVSFN